MAISRDSLSAIPKCFASCSIGCKPSHQLPDKLRAIAAAGFTAVELSFPDLLAFAAAHLQRERVDAADYDALCAAARAVRALCAAPGLAVLVLQPFARFEGWPAGSAARRAAFERARGWIRIMAAAGTDMLQVGASDADADADAAADAAADAISGDDDALAADLRELADMLAAHGFRLAYENWCWATRAPRWRDVWELAQRVDRPNFGLCLDTFQTAGGEWGDPTTESGVIEDPEDGGEGDGEGGGGGGAIAAAAAAAAAGNEGGKRSVLEARFRESLAQLSATVPPEKIFFLQISDAYKVSPPLSAEPRDGLRPRGRWSHDFRPIPGAGGYLPVRDVARAVLRTGFRGWMSVEIFDGGPDGTWTQTQYDDLPAFAANAKRLLDQFLEQCATE